MVKSNEIDVESPRIGRPRANQTTPSGPVREEILGAARALFREKGFKGTSTREIAERAGLRQPSLFHYFKNKGEIFRAVALGAVQPVLEFIAEEEQHKWPVDTALYRLVYFDTYHLCTNDNVLGSPHQFPELTRDSQPEFWQQREQIIDHYKSLLRKGDRSNVFKVKELEITTQFLFSLGESTVTWFRNQGDLSAKKVAETAAMIVLRSVLTEPSRAEDIARHLP